MRAYQTHVKMEENALLEKVLALRTHVIANYFTKETTVSNVS